MQSGSLEKKTISGLFWSFSDLIANQGLHFIIHLILVRLLVPKDFGIIGMITVFISISQLFIDSGFTNALIREKEPSQEDYSTAFYFNLLVAVLLYGVLFFTANNISTFFNEPQLTLILKVLALVLIINSFGLIQRTMLTKMIEFKIQTKISVISSVLSGIISIGFAYMGFGVWSLVVRTLSMQFLQSFLLCIYNRWVPSLVFRISSFKRLFGFEWKLLASGLIDTIYNNLFYLIIGKVFSAEDLGYYTNAQKLRDTASQTITTAVQKVSYPVLSSINGEEEKLKNGYRRIIKSSVFIVFPLMIWLAAAAKPLFLFLFGSRWVRSIPYFQVLCFAGMLFPLHAINLNILQVKGRSDLFLRLEIIKKLIGITAIGAVLFFGFGIMGLIWATVVTSFIAYFINSYYSAELLSYSTWEQIKDIFPVFGCSIGSGILVFVVDLLLPVGPFIKVAILMFAGLGAYIGLCRSVNIDELDSISNLLGRFFLKK